MKNIALMIVILGAMLLGGGIAYGLTDVSVADGGSCGSAFSKTDSYTLTDVGNDACAAERSNRMAVSIALLVTGGIGVLLGGITALSIGQAERDEQRRLEAARQQAAALAAGSPSHVAQ